MANTNRNFNEILAEVDSGELILQLSEALAQISSAVLETGKVGELTLKLKFKLNKGRKLFVESDYGVKVPKKSIEVATFFADDHGNLSRRDPQQQELFNNLREVK